MLFEFECIQCSNKVEVIQKTNDPSPFCVECTCQAPMKKLISRTSFILRGQGWAKDLYTKSSKPK